MHAAEYTETDSIESELYIPFWYNIIAIGCLKELPEDSAQVQSAVEQVYKDMIDMVEDDINDGSGEYLTEAEFAEAFSEGISDMINDPELLKMVELQCGNGAAEYIIRAVQVFSNTRK